MQPLLGKMCARSTVWRRENGKVKKAKPSGSLLETFVLFSGAAIDLFNAGQKVTIENILDGPPQGSLGLKYHRVPKKLFDRLSKSGFSPQLLAIATCALLPPNYRRGVGPGSRSGNLNAQHEKLLNDKAGSEMWRIAFEKEESHMIGRPSIARKDGGNAKANEIVQLDSTNESSSFDWEKELEEIDKRNNWREPTDGKVQKPSKQPLKGLVYCERNGASAFPFRGGATIDRKMVSWWRRKNQKKYVECLAFIRSLLVNGRELIPRIPDGPVSRPAYLISPILARSLRRSHSKATRVTST